MDLFDELTNILRPMKQTNQKLPAGLVDDNIEIFAHENKISFARNGVVLSIHELEKHIKDHFRREMYSNKDAVKLLSTWCKNENEILRRVYCRFIAEAGRKYPMFNPVRHYVKPFKIDPMEWNIYGGVDIGSGGPGSGHPAAMGMLAVAKDYKKAYIFDGCRMDDIETSSGDILDKYIEVRGSYKPIMQVYDQASKDFFIIASRSGESFSPSEKNHEIGEDIVNTLFQNDMLFIFDKPEMRKLGQELLTLMKGTPKKVAKDDFIDGAVRYPCASIPWDWSNIRDVDRLPANHDGTPAKTKKSAEQKYEEWVDEQRRGGFEKNRGPNGEEGEGYSEFNQEIQFWNSQYG